MVTGQIGALVVPTLGWQIMFLIGGIPGLVVTALLLRLPESPRWLISKGRLTEAAAIIREIEVSSEKPDGSTPNSQEPTSNFELQTPNLRVTRWAELLSPIYRRRTIVVWILWACAYFVTNGLNNWMPTMYNSVYRLGLSDSLRAGTLTNIAQVIILAFCAFVIDRIGRQRWTAACFAAGALLLASLGLFASGAVNAVIAIVTATYGLVGSVNAVLYLYTPEIYPTRMRALGTGSATCWLRLSSAAAPLLVGYLVQGSGPGAVFMMFAAAGAIGMVAGTMMLETRNRRLEDIAP
jgi:putative MFS transporter